MLDVYGSLNLNRESSPPPNQVDIRRHNLATILRFVRERGQITRADLAAGSGLNRVTVLDLVGELQANGFLQESEPIPTGKSGRPARGLEMDDSRLIVGSLEIMVDRLVLVCATLQGRTVYTDQHDLDPENHSWPTVLDVAAEALAKAQTALSSNGMKMVGVSVGCPAFVDHKAGTVLKSRSLGWDSVAVLDDLRARTSPGVTFTLDRLANLAINAERRSGGWDREDGLLLLYGDLGVGGSYQKHSQILQGDSGVGAEFGHLPLDYGGRQCYCGHRGCLDTYVGLGPLSTALGMNRDELSFQPASAILQAVAEGGREVREELARQGVWLARAVSALTTIFDPRAVILGGHLTALAPLMMPSFNAELHTLNDGFVRPRVEVKISTLGTAAVLAGGIEAAIGRVTRAPWAIPSNR